MNSHPPGHRESGITARRVVMGFSLKEFSQPANCRLPWHVHEHASVCFVAFGFYRERARGREHECATHSMVFKPSGEPHADVFGRAGGRCLLIELLPERSAAIRSLSRITETPTVTRSSRLAALGLRLHDEFFQVDSASSLALEGLILELLADATRAAADESRGAEPRWLRHARELLHDRLDDGPSLTSIAGDVGVHPSHLARTFRKRSGCTMGEYVRRLRIERAAQDIATSSVSLSEISVRSGFFDQSHFTKAFRRHTGLTPAEYRARVRARTS